MPYGHTATGRAGSRASAQSHHLCKPAGSGCSTQAHPGPTGSCGLLQRAPSAGTHWLRTLLAGCCQAP